MVKKYPLDNINMRKAGIIVGIALVNMVEEFGYKVKLEFEKNGRR
ncbi:hypothetical protein LCGC14_1819310 [marine sediment metagenome]|uniref:Uncharacterized protein n=1 Tax=marine sediment metagenome TaxID=412755 RepID=A0A0F9JIZ8_9ZZZZ